MRRFMTITATIVVALLVATAAMAQIRGRGRLQGMVTDKATGKPVVGATVTVAFASENTVPIIVKTDSRGHWSALGLVSGRWNIDIAATGYETSRGTANISEIQQLPMVQTQLTPAVAEEPVAAPKSPLIPKEAVDAINEGQELLKQQKYKEAIVDFEKALPLVPTDKPEVRSVYDQLVQVMAQAYYRAGDLKNAIAMLEKVIATDPKDTNAQVLLANLYLENGQLDAGKAMLDKLPPGAITDPTAYINLGILFLNKKNPDNAIPYFTKAIELDAKSADGYYYRGLAQAQLKKVAGARADFQQVLVLAPGTDSAKDAKAMLDGLPKK